MSVNDTKLYQFHVTMNFYGHPHKQTLERLEDRGIRVFRTDISGAVSIDIHGERLSVDLYKEAPQK